jgi:DNA gyrase/topoisomerase IV subunit B
MDTEELAETTLNPRTRTLRKGQIYSNLEADKAFVELLGKDASERQRIVMEKTALVEEEDLDV